MSERRDMPIPIFFGCLEAMAFFALFIAPLLGNGVWLAVALMRTVVLSALLLPGRACREGSDWSLSVLGQSLLYQVPFWGSALLFPLASGQTVAAGQAFLQQCVLFALLAATARWSRRLSAEGMVGLMTLGWVATWRPPGPWLAISGLLVILVGIRGASSRRGVGWPLSLAQSLAVGLGWMGGVALPPLAGQPGRGVMVLLWLFMLYLVGAICALQREGATVLEDETPLPGVAAARFWLQSRRTVMVAAGWAAVPLTCMQSPQEAVAGLVVLTGWYRAVELSARRWFTAERAVWWLALETTWIWAALLCPARESVAVLAGSMAYAVLTRLRRGLAETPEYEEAPLERVLLERRLREDLSLAAPPDFASRVRQVSDSVELDADLTATAPAGFRERLLQRLRQGAETDE